MKLILSMVIVALIILSLYKMNEHNIERANSYNAYPMMLSISQDKGMVDGCVREGKKLAIYDEHKIEAGEIQNLADKGVQVCGVQSLKSGLKILAGVSEVIHVPVKLAIPYEMIKALSEKNTKHVLCSELTHAILSICPQLNKTHINLNRKSPGE